MPARDTKKLSALWSARQTCKFGAYSPIFMGFGAARGVSTELDSFLDTPGFVLQSFVRLHACCFEATKEIYICRQHVFKKETSKSCNFFYNKFFVCVRANGTSAKLYQFMVGPIFLNFYSYNPPI
jgi:hypothetical protein